MVRRATLEAPAALGVKRRCDSERESEHWNRMPDERAGHRP